MNAPTSTSTKSWSPQQTEIFNWFATGKGNLVVRALAGCGKTSTIIEGINHAPEDKILLAAFNKRIATELKDRLANPYAEAKTLHALGFGFVVRNWSGLKVDSNGERVRNHAKQACGNDTPDSIQILVARLATSAKEMAPFAKDQAELIDIQDSFDIFPDPDEYRGTGYDDLFVRKNALKVLEIAKHRDGMLDFADMLYLPLINGFTHGQFNLVCIDEAQDMNYAQLVLAQRCCKPGGRIVVVGDPNQAIYGFRGADSGSLDRLKAELGAGELGLTITYRCPKAVVALAQKLVPDFQAADSAPEGEVLSIPLGKLPEMVAVGDFVLSRKNAPLAGLCLKLLRRGIRAKVEGRGSARGRLPS